MYIKYYHGTKVDKYFKHPVYSLVILSMKDCSIYYKDIRINLRRKRLTSIFIESLYSNCKYYMNMSKELPKIIKKIKNYKRDWFKGDLERTVNKEIERSIFLGGI